MVDKLTKREFNSKENRKIVARAYVSMSIINYNLILINVNK